ncbi:MAG: hypothetical protein B6D37_05115 [Sphingobacteriales bacterium UTBCD1]|jgi:hypothetical protein|nr:MAG: hypothetical protein B6D37_05115 [Sphingobacteriales bacterium UTBCD1]
MEVKYNISRFNERSKLAAWAAWLVTLFLAVTGFQRIREVIVYVMMKVYEFFIQRNTVNI